MNKRILNWSLALLAACSLFSAPLAAQDDLPPSIDKELTEKLAPVIEKALLAYNEGDYKTFYADYTKSMEGITTELAFDGLYKGMYFPKYGKYTPDSKQLIPVESMAMKGSEVVLLFYTGKFEKGDKDNLARIAVNMIKEGEDYKVMQIQMADNIAMGQ